MSAGKNKSPLRYPGGKTRAIKILERYVEEYYPNRKVLLSPFFGGGSFELHIKENYSSVFANDLFGPLYHFWVTLQHNRENLIARIKSKMPVSKSAFHTMRDTIVDERDTLEQAAMYFCINRSSFSGATLCGGFSQQAAQKRLTLSSLEAIRKCNVGGVTFSNIDCCDFLIAHPETEETIIFADPPYYIDNYIYGKDGDLHQQFDHEKFANTIQSRKDWILTYNDCPKIRNLYSGCQFFTESWSYGMNTSKRSNEVIILPAES